MKHIFTVHAGHNEDGKVGCGAIGFCKESTECRKIAKHLNKLLNKDNKSYNVTCSTNDVNSNLYILCERCNHVKPYLNISIHLNACKKENKNEKVKGCECYIYSKTSRYAIIANKICDNLAKLGFTDRGVKNGKNLYVIKNTNEPTILVECFFCDDYDDVALYNKVGYKKVANAIYKAII